MKGKRLIQWHLGMLLLVFGLSSCQVKRPKEVLPDAKMESLLYDYHIAKAMGEDAPREESYKRLLYVESVFKKHGITQADFDSSMVWFARHPEVITKIYEKVNARLKAERDIVNNLIAVRENRPVESLPGDSIDVWIGRRIYRLSGVPMNNKLTFTLPSDTNFHDRDTLRWNMRFRFYDGPPDSLHRPLIAMQVKYGNDSIVHSSLLVAKNGTETLELSADTLGEIKEIRGFIYYPMQDSAKVLLIDHISLMRYHATDSLSYTLKDSLEGGRLKKEEIIPQSKPAEVPPAALKDSKDNNVERRRSPRTRPVQREAVKMQHLEEEKVK